MKTCGPTLDDHALDQLEIELNCGLPIAYRAFLKRYNGGRPIPACFPLKGLTNNPFGQIQFFFGFRSEIKAYDLVWNRESCKQLIGQDYLPIACDDGGSIVCISLRHRIHGGVYFWLFAVEYDESNNRVDNPEKNIYYVADTFEDFLASLQDAPED